MDKVIRVAVDAMGGDLAPVEPIKGAVAAMNEEKRVVCVFYGKKEVIEEELSKYTYDKNQVEIVDCREVIEMGESPVLAIRSKKDSSIVKAMLDVHDGKCDSYLSAGSTGANLVGAQVLVGRLKGIERPPLAPLIPTSNGPKLIIDCGANVDAKPSYLVQYAMMGSIYMKHMMGIDNPKVGLLNIGTEEEKGNALVKETFPLLKSLPEINFIGSVEARDIPAGVCDVIVCDAFAGNLILKMYEGVGKTLLSEVKSTLMSNIKTKLGAALIKKELKKTLIKYDMHQYGSAPLLGLTGLVCKTHGSATSAEFRNSILEAVEFADKDVNGKIKEWLSGRADI